MVAVLSQLQVKVYGTNGCLLLRCKGKEGAAVVVLPSLDTLLNGSCVVHCVCLGEAWCRHQHGYWIIGRKCSEGLPSDHTTLRSPPWAA